MRSAIHGGLVASLLLLIGCSAAPQTDAGIEPPDAGGNGRCGNGRLEPDESCDTAIASGQGRCPSALDCNDNIACTADVLDVAAGNLCSAVCRHQAIVMAGPSDGCCPSQGNAGNDPDCAGCGDGVVQPTETCDTAVTSGLSKCPTAADCDDGDPCTTDALVGGGSCQAACTHKKITAFIGGDKCCPTGAHANNDADCAPVCGNGQLETNELCDSAIAAGQPGACVTAAQCNDNIACTADSVNLPQGNACRAQCAHTPVTLAGPADGCCPPGASPGSDPDCAGCGDGVVQASETCDTAIASGPNKCPTAADCNDGKACTVDSLVGGGTCTAACAHAQNTSLMPGDGCCLDPASTLRSTDSDCPKVSVGFPCVSAVDCDSSRCEAFDGYGGNKYCTASCQSNAVTPASTCPASANTQLQAVCLSRASESGGANQNLCAYDWVTAQYAYLPLNTSLQWSLADSSAFNAWLLPFYADGVARTFTVSVTPAAGLNVAVANMNPSLTGSRSICDVGGLGGAEQCTISLQAADSFERQWVLVYSPAGSGSYTISLTKVP